MHKHNPSSLQKSVNGNKAKKETQSMSGVENNERNYPKKMDMGGVIVVVRSRKSVINTLHGSIRAYGPASRKIRRHRRLNRDHPPQTRIPTRRQRQWFLESAMHRRRSRLFKRTYTHMRVFIRFRRREWSGKVFKGAGCRAGEGSCEIFKRADEERGWFFQAQAGG